MLHPEVCGVFMGPETRGSELVVSCYQFRLVCMHLHLDRICTQGPDGPEKSTAS